MKKVIVLAAFAVFASAQLASAQTNLQTFYDFGKDRKHATTTLEMFKGDKWGDTFFFVDYDYVTKEQRQKDVAGVTGSYMEISRAINFWQDSKLAPLSAHVEFNGGVGFGNSNFLFGANYFIHSKDFSKRLTLELMYKTFNGNASSDLPLQFTAVWGIDNLFGVDGLCFSGFADIWGENNSFWYGDANPLAAAPGKFTFLSEPQLWYNIGKLFGMDNLNIGGEVELAYNFAGCSGFYCRPCLGTKWNF